MTPTDKAIDRYMNEQVDFGGEMMSRADVYRWFAENLYPKRAAELWLIGYERTHRAQSV